MTPIGTRQSAIVNSLALVAAILGEIEALRRARPAAGPAESASTGVAPTSRPRSSAADQLARRLGDERLIRQIALLFQSAWARADAEELAALWTDDGDVVHPDGNVERGRSTIRLHRAELFARKEYRGSRHPLTVGAIQFRRPDVAVVDGSWELSGVRDGSGAEAAPVQGLYTMVVTQQEGGSRRGATPSAAPGRAGPAAEPGRDLRAPDRIDRILRDRPPSNPLTEGVTTLEHAATVEHGLHAEHEQELSWIWKYVFSTDHKVIGIWYATTALFFLLFGFGLMMLMRWSLAFPNTPIPLIGQFLGQLNAPGGIMLPEFYNQLGAMHGTIMVFMGVVPLAVGGFGNYVLPLQIGAPDMAFPRINMASYWAFFVGGVIMLASFFAPGGAANSGWTSYAPLSVIATQGQTWWLVGMVFLITSSLLGSINFITTTFQLRAPGLSFMRLPFFVWAQLVTAFLLLLAFPPLEAAAVLQLMDRLAGTSFFMPSGLVVSGVVQPNTGGGSPLLWQHLFWFLAHPEVYVLILPGMGIVAEVIANNTRKPLWGYRAMVYSIVFLGFMSFIVWAHHMFLTGMGTTMSAFFQTTTMIISIPSVVILSALFISLYGGSIHYTVPMLFALAFLPMFGIGGLTGLPLGLAPTDISLHDTYYVIGHFHYVVAPGTIFALFAGIYYWYPKVTGRRMNDLLGKIHFWGSLLCINGVFFPMFIQGMAGVNRRLYDGGLQYAHAQGVLHWNVFMSYSAWGLGLFQLFFILNFFWSMKKGQKVSDNPWNATTLEWMTPTPPPHGNFARPPQAYRGPYEYSVPGDPTDFTSQGQPVTGPARVPEPHLETPRH